MYWNIAMNLFPNHHAKCFLGTVAKDAQVKEFPASGPFRQTPITSKLLSVFALQSASVQFQANLKPEKVSYFVDADRTKIPWFVGNRQVSELSKIWSLDLAKQIRPVPCSENKPLLLDVADYAAYVSAKALGKSAHAKDEFVRHFHALNASVGEFHLDLQGFVAHAATVSDSTQ
jgi:hypothetical protein